MASHSNGRRTHNWTRRHFRSRLQSMIQHPLGSPRTGCTSLSSDHIRSPLLSIRLCSCQVRTHTPHTVGVAPWVETVTAGGTLMVMGTAATRAVETAMPTARATVRPCSPRSHRRSSASRARTVRTRPRSDHRSTGHIQATCPQSYSPPEVAGTGPHHQRSMAASHCTASRRHTWLASCCLRSMLRRFGTCCNQTGRSA